MRPVPGSASFASSCVFVIAPSQHSIMPIVEFETEIVDGGYYPTQTPVM